MNVLPFYTMAQKIAISGYVKDAASKEALIGISVVNANTETGNSANQYGFFSLTVPVADTIELLVSYQGYKINAKKLYFCGLTILFCCKLHLLRLNKGKELNKTTKMA